MLNFKGSKILQKPWESFGSPLKRLNLKTWGDTALQNETLDFPCSAPGKKCLQNIRVFSKLWTHSWNAKIKHSDLHRNQPSSSVVRVRAGSWFINTSFSWHPKNEIPSVTSASDPVQPTGGCENSPGFLTTDISDTELCQLVFLLHCTTPALWAIQTKIVCKHSCKTTQRGWINGLAEFILGTFWSPLLAHFPSDPQNKIIVLVTS